MINRSELREIIIKILYQINIFESCNIEFDIKDLVKENIEIENEFVNNILNGILENRTLLKEKSNNYLKGWTLDRLSKVDQAILLLGIYELLYTDTPPIVCINESIELAKKYSDLKVIDMINGVLDNIYHNEIKE